jgi:c-di-GMP-binding flagellar brake protein YcgR
LNVSTLPAQTPLPRLNQRLEVAVGERGGAAQYFSRLVEETSETLRISLPEMEGDSMQLREGESLRLWYTQSGGYWCLHTLVRQVYRSGDETLVEIDRTGDVHRAQRRNHVRVDVSLLLHATVDVRVASDELEEGEGAPGDGARVTGGRISGVTRNISGGGLSFRTPEQLVLGDRMSITFYLPEHGGEISSKARVVHAHPDPEKEGQWVVACTFERMAITDRERIIRFLFFRQRELASRRRAGAR